MSGNNAFTPDLAGTVAAAGVTTTTAFALPFTAEQQVLVTALPGNTTVAFIRFGISTVTATTAVDVPILPGSAQLFSVGPAATHVAVVSASAATLYFTCGHGS
jgi:hypothetical protein